MGPNAAPPDEPRVEALASAPLYRSIGGQSRMAEWLNADVAPKAPGLVLGLRPLAVGLHAGERLDAERPTTRVGLIDGIALRRPVEFVDGTEKKTRPIDVIYYYFYEPPRSENGGERTYVRSAIFRLGKPVTAAEAVRLVAAGPDALAAASSHVTERELATNGAYVPWNTLDAERYPYARGQ